MINLGSAHLWAAAEATNVEVEINKCCLQMCVRVLKKKKQDMVRVLKATLLNQIHSLWYFLVLSSTY